MKSKSTFFFLGSSIAIAVAVYFQFPSGEPKVVDATERAIPPVTALNATPAIPAASVSAVHSSIGVGATISAKPWAKLYRDLALSRDYRVTFESLLQKGGDGGGYYAFQILHMCASMRMSASRFESVAPESEKQRAARDVFVARCSTFTSDELSGDRVVDAISDARLKNDPLRALRNQWADAQSGPNRAAVLQQILDSRDPMLIEQVGPGALLSADGKTTKIDGVTYDQPNAQQILSLAWTAAVCEATAAECGPLDPYVVTACAAANVCLDNRTAVLAHDANVRFGDAGLRLYKEVYPKLVTAIRSQRASAFQ